MDKTLSALRKEMYELAGQWNGDMPTGESEALAASEVVEKIDEIEELLAVIYN